MRLFFAFFAFLLAAALCCAQGAIPPGTYKGTWTGAQSNGDFHLTIHQDGKTADVGFSIAGTEIPCKITSVKIEGALIEIVYEFDLEGNSLKSNTKGSLQGKSLEGSYKTMAGDTQVDEGTWKAAAQ